MIKLVKSLNAWNSEDFNSVLKQEVESLDASLLPLQQGLSQSSYVCERPFTVMMLQASDENQHIKVKLGISYSGVIAGSCCADDPAPLDEQVEYCEVELMIDKATADTSITLVND